MLYINMGNIKKNYFQEFYWNNCFLILIIIKNWSKRKYKPQIVAFSGLLTTTLDNIPDNIKAIEDAGLRKKIILAVGGAPVTRQFADMNGIEIYADDASSASKEFLIAVV